MERRGADRYEKLLEPTTCGGVRLRNRIVMPAMGTRMPELDGSVNERLKLYYAARAKGGVGAIIVECSEVDAAGRSARNHVRVDHDRYVSGLAELVGVIHDAGCPALLQLVHGGRMTLRQFADADPVGPSAVAAPGRDVPKVLSKGDISRLVAQFAEAAARAKTAGFDGVQIHGAHHYLINQFLSPWSNRRDDEYGGSVENRARFALEVIAAVRAAVGQDYPVWFRFNGHEYGVDGVTVEHALVTANLVERAGVDLLDVSAFGYNHTEMLHASPLVPGMLVPLAEAIKRQTRLPVIAVGWITPRMGEQVLRDGKATLIALGRQLLADPDLPNKLARGAVEDIRPCLNCGQCNASAGGNVAIRCTVNQFLSHEADQALPAAARSKRVVVVGGGPAGMEVASIAAARGHSVALLERESTLGGQLSIAGNPPYKGDMAALARYLETKARKAGVEIQLGREATAYAIAALQPEEVVIAAGARPAIPSLEGMAQLPVVTANDVLAGVADTGRRVVVVGGELVGCETAEYLADRGKTVAVTRRGPEMATKVTPRIREGLLNRLAQKGVRLICGIQYRGVTSLGLVVVDREGKEELLPADTLVMAAGSTPEGAELAAALVGSGQEVHFIGDCREPRGIIEALNEALAVGRAL